LSSSVRQTITNDLIVHWNWNGSHPSGTVGEVKAGEVTVVSHRGNEISKTGTASNPAVHIERSGNDVVKTANELHVDKPAASSSSNGTSENKEEKKEAEAEKKEDKKAEKKEVETEKKEEVKKKEEKKAEKKDAEAEKKAETKKKEDKKVETAVEKV